MKTSLKKVLPEITVDVFSQSQEALGVGKAEIFFISSQFFTDYHQHHNFVGSFKP